MEREGSTGTPGVGDDEQGAQLQGDRENEQKERERERRIRKKLDVKSKEWDVLKRDVKAQMGGMKPSELMAQHIPVDGDERDAGSDGYRADGDSTRRSRYTQRYSP